MCITFLKKTQLYEYSRLVSKLLCIRFTNLHHMVRLYVNILNEELPKCPICGSENGFGQEGIFNIKYFCKACKAKWKASSGSTPVPMKLVDGGKNSGVDSLLEIVFPFTFWKKFDIDKLGIQETGQGLEIGEDIYYSKFGGLVSKDKIYEIIKSHFSLDLAKNLFFKTHCKTCDSIFDFPYSRYRKIETRLKIVNNRMMKGAVSGMLDTFAGDYTTSELKNQTGNRLIDEKLSLGEEMNCPKCDSYDLERTLVYGIIDDSVH